MVEILSRARPSTTHYVDEMTEIPLVGTVHLEGGGRKAES
jgi:hypothetical protein